MEITISITFCITFKTQILSWCFSVSKELPILSDSISIHLITCTLNTLGTLYKMQNKLRVFHELPPNAVILLWFPSKVCNFSKDYFWHLDQFKQHCNFQVLWLNQQIKQALTECEAFINALWVILIWKKVYRTSTVRKNTALNEPCTVLKVT